MQLGVSFLGCQRPCIASSNHSMSIPPASQRRLIELCHLCRRATEEKQLVIAESLRMLQFYSAHSESAGSIGMNSLLLHLQHQRCESVCRTLVQAYWSDDTEAQSLLKAAMRQCRREVILTTEPLRVDCQDSVSCDHRVTTGLRCRHRE